ncbi:MAG: hypothetical protein RIE73_37295 [Coleofasciculus sp. C1-SOL-03]|jgi:hypothetical protein
MLADSGLDIHTYKFSISVFMKFIFSLYPVENHESQGRTSVRPYESN